MLSFSSIFIVFFLVLAAMAAPAAGASSATRIGPFGSAPLNSSPEVTSALNSTSKQTLSTETALFSDVRTGDQFFTEIMWLAEHGISTGWTHPDGSRTYGPLLSVNRDAMAAFMYRFAGKPEFSPPVTSPFADVPPGTQFYKEITWLSEKGISTGWREANGTSTFRPIAPVNRDAMAAFMYRFAGSPDYGTPGRSFLDVSKDNQFHTQITWLASHGISTGWIEPDGSATYRPLNAVNRDAMAAFLYRLSRVTQPLKIKDGSLHEGKAGTRYLDKLEAAGGIPPLTWTASGLPVGMTLTTDGAISGIPTETGANNVTFTVADAAGSVDTAVRTVSVPTSMPAECVGQACAKLKASARTVEIPADQIVSIARNATTEKVSSVVLRGTTVSGKAIAAGQVLVLAPTPQIESGSIVYADSIEKHNDGTITAAVTPTTPADAYTEGTVNSIDPTIPSVDTLVAPARGITEAVTGSEFRCGPGVTTTLNGLSVTPNMTPSLAAIWKHPIFGGGGVYVGFGGLDLFQIDLDGTIAVDLGVTISGAGQCTLTLPGVKTRVPAGNLGFVVLAAAPTITLEVSRGVDLSGRITLKCGAEYRWQAGIEDRTSYCSATHNPLQISTDLAVQAKVTGAIETRVALNDIAGITGQINAGIEMNYTPLEHPVATIDGTVGWEIGACLACFWSDMPFKVTLFSGTFFRKRIATFDIPLPPTSSPAPLSIMTTRLPSGTPGVAYRASIATTGGISPHTWTLSDGALPPGLVLGASTGTLTGVPSVNGTYTMRITVTDARGTQVHANLTVIVQDSGQLASWGEDVGGNLGRVATGDSTSASTVFGPKEVAQVYEASGSESTTFALTRQGEVWSWGSSNSTVLGRTPDAFGSASFPGRIGGLPPIGRLLMNTEKSFVFALDRTGGLWGWGKNRRGELGNGTTDSTFIPTRISNLPALQDVSIYDGLAQAMCVTALASDGTLWGWGACDYLGTTPAPVHRSLPQIPAVKQIIGGHETVALTSDGQVWAWQPNWPQYVYRLAGLPAMDRVYPNQYNDVFFGTTANGELWSWGNENGALLGSGRTDLQPARVVGPTNVTAVQTSREWRAGAPGTWYLVLSVLAITSQGDVWVWGANDSGQLGLGDSTDRSSPAKLSGLPPVSSLQITPTTLGDSDGFAGQAVVALTSSGSLWSWGAPVSGLLGTGSKVPALRPAVISGLPVISDFTMSGGTVLALTADGSVWQWGRSVAYGPISRNPQLVGGLTGIQDVWVGNNAYFATT
jgi:alpha-tubulin suppressor-like RCC1 family protein